MRAAAKAELVSFANFLEETPPSRNVEIAGLCREKISPNGSKYYQLAHPEIELHCEKCNGLRVFRFDDASAEIFDKTSETLQTFVTYECSNCQEVDNIFSLWAKRTSQTTGTCYKFGELPVYGPRTPGRLIKLFEEERETFFKGRRCESQGLGIGAFVYYRRVVENQKNRILDEIIRVAEKSKHRLP